MLHALKLNIGGADLVQVQYVHNQRRNIHFKISTSLYAYTVW